MLVGCTIVPQCVSAGPAVASPGDAHVAGWTARPARADERTGAPPPEAKGLGGAPKIDESAPKVETPTDETRVTVAAGGQMATGDSQLGAATADGKLGLRRGADGFGAASLGNY